MELCGGIHVEHSSQIGPVAVLGESSVGSGVRRIEAYTGMDSFRFLSDEKSVMAGLSTSLKAQSAEVPDRIEALTAKLRAAEKQIQQLKHQQLANQVGELVAKAEFINGMKVLAQRLPDGVAAGDLRTLAQDAKGRLGSDPAVVLFVSNADGKVPFVAAVNDAAVAKGAKAGDIVKAFGEKVNGRGGGKPAMAQGSGSDAAGITAGIDAVRDAIERLG